MAAMESTSASINGEETLPNIPKMILAQWKFRLQHPSKHFHDADASQIKNMLMDEVCKENMAPYYRLLCKDLHWNLDAPLLADMERRNAESLAEIDARIEDSKGLGESEIRESLLAKSEFYVKIGNKDAAIAATKETLEKTVGIGNRMDLVFSNVRVGLFFMDHELIKANIERAKQMMEEGGDWDRRNRLKVYEGLYAMAVRDFAKAASLFLETISTFTSYELMSYRQFISYTVYVSLFSLERRQLHEKVIKGSEILEVLHDCPDVKKFLFSLYECHYGDFFQALAEVEDWLKKDRYLFPHYAFYIREMKVKAYTQLLESYRSLTLTFMAEAFRVTEDYVDKELSKFIADGRLHCRIDKVRGIVITNRPDSKNAQYQASIKQGDILLNRLTKLSRVINI